MKAFKIKDKDGDFSTGGRYPNWTKRGKTWGKFTSNQTTLKTVLQS